MTPTSDDPLQSFENTADPTGAAPTQLRARANHWAKLCDELTSYADEFRALRGEITQRDSETAEEERGIEERDAALRRREEEVERRQQDLELNSTEFEQQRQRAIHLQLDEMRASQVNDRRFLRAAKLELRANQRCNDAEALLQEYESIGAELTDMTREIGDAFSQFAADVDELRNSPPAA